MRGEAASSRVLERATLMEILRAARAAGRRIVFTNGAFDLLHLGHVRVLEAAAALGDLLVVGVNGDESVRGLRGPARPVVPAHERALLVAALACVHYVVVFPEASVESLLEDLRPHVHAKGTDYEVSSLPERATDLRLGIEMAFVGGPKRRSASTLLARAAAAAEGGERLLPWQGPQAVGWVGAGAKTLLEENGRLDLAHLVTTRDGRLVEGTARRWVRRIDVAGTPVYVKVTYPAERRRSPLVEVQNHLVLRAAGFRAPRPFFAAEGRVKGRPAGVLVTREAPGQALDAWLGENLEGLGPRARLAVAGGIGRAVRALHAARFLFPDLQAWHLLVDASPVGGRASITFLDLMRLKRAARDVGPAAAAPGLAALALSLRPVTDARFRLAILRAYLGGSLREAAPFAAALLKRTKKLKQRGTFRQGGEGP